MRISVDIADDVLAPARALASERGISIGKALSELARRGLQPRSRYDGDLPVFEVPPDAPPLTPEMVDRTLDE